MRTPRGLPTASRLQLAATCAASAVLPVVDSAWATGEAGHDKHDALAGNLRDPSFKAPTSELAAWLERVMEAAGELNIIGTRDEVAYAYDVTTGAARLLGERMGRNYHQRPSEFAGSADYVRVEAGRVVVVDLKTGMGETPHPSRNAQLRALAMMAARVHGVAAARVGLLLAPEGQEPRWQWADMDAFELEAVAVELRTLAERIEYARRDVEAGKTPRLTVGEHCAHCPARFGCPARVAMAQRLAGEPEAVVLDLKAMLTPESAALALARWKAARKALDEVGAALHAYAKESPITVGDGRVWGPVETEREEIDADTAWPVLVARYGAEAARAAMTLDTSKAGVERMARVVRELPGSGKPTIKSLMTEALDVLRKAGAVSVKVTTRYEERQAALPTP